MIHELIDTGQYADISEELAGVIKRADPVEYSQRAKTAGRKVLMGSAVTAVGLGAVMKSEKPLTRAAGFVLGMIGTGKALWDLGDYALLSEGPQVSTVMTAESIAVTQSSPPESNHSHLTLIPNQDIHQ